jgi:hypothetical protein
VLNGLYLLYTSQNLLGTIFRVTFTVFYRRIWNIVGKYSILCCDRGLGLAVRQGYKPGSRPGGQRCWGSGRLGQGAEA